MISKVHTKYIQSLQHKKFRDEFNVFMAEGYKVIFELLDSDKFICKELFALSDWLNEYKNALNRYNIGVIAEVKDFELGKLSALSTPNKVLGIFQKAQENKRVDLKNKITVVLDTIQDPGNLGTIIRTADWFSIENIICSYGCADIYSPKVVQSTMGSLARVNIIYTDITEWLQKNSSIHTYAAAMKGINIKDLKKITEAIIIIGNESKGISDNIMQMATQKITIPRVGKAESLNAAVAAGIILSHVC